MGRNRLDGILNGIVGHHLQRSGNPLAIEMGLFHRGTFLPIERSALGRVHPAASSRLVLLVHGLIATEAMWEWTDGADYGSRLEADLGYTALYLRYNSGLGIAENGERLAHLLERLNESYPVAIDELVLIGHSMGGLVVRSACHAASLSGLHWLGRVKRAIYIGTPHLGAPLERLGRSVAKLLRAVPDPYTRLLAEIADFRSDGIKDLGDAVLRSSDRGLPVTALSITDPRHPVPLLPAIRHHLIAGSLRGHPLVAALFGDAMVPLHSALGGVGPPPLPPSRMKVLTGIPHVALAHHPDVYAQLRQWCADPIS